MTLRVPWHGCEKRKMFRFRAIVIQTTGDFNIVSKLLQDDKHAANTDLLQRGLNVTST